jgi:SAM-dependent methyltransferase
VLDRAFLDSPACQAARNRRGLLADEILRVIEQKHNGPARVTSLACGPAREIFDVLDRLEDPSLIETTLLDIDFQALSFVSDLITAKKLKRQLNLVQANLIYLATGRQTIKLANQDLVYSIGLIDYFDGKFVIALLNYIYSILAPGGKVILGNFHTSSVCKAFMDYVLDWRLNHRNEDDMNRLYAASKFGRPCTNIRFEKTGTNLFAECIKE